VPTTPAPRPAPKVRVGRYELVELLGSGGMGSVYRAHDPDLSRDVALKVLHQRFEEHPSSSDYRHRLLREAQALAKLSHPNVVAAFDVGTHEDILFVAMELVPGESLRDWLTQPRSPQEVLKVMIAAGHGLVAAHTAGVLHRDFKPANVMVSPDGRVRVVDFGLARATGANGSLEPEPVPLAELEEDNPSLLQSELTETGMLLGTPGYVAPEQLRGEPANMLTDQYGFAVTAFVAVTGQRPYGGSTLASYRAALFGDAPIIWPRGVPRRLRRVIERGLARSPEDRYPSVAAMVEALEELVAPRRRIGALVALALGSTLVATTVVMAKSRVNRAATCEVGASLVARAWDPARASALKDAFAATGRANADEAFGLFARRLDGFEADWLAMRKDSCEATHVRGEQSENVLALRNACLDRKLEGVAALVNAFSHPDAAAVDRAAGAAPDGLDECADTAALLGVADKLPKDPDARRAIEGIRAQFPVTRALMTAGRWREAVDGAEKLLEKARETGHEPSIAEAMSWVARAVYSGARTADERRRAEVLLRESIHLAAIAGDDQLVARTASYMFNIIAYGQRRTLESEAMLPSVDALVLRAGDEPLMRTEVLMGQARALGERRRFAEAIELFQRAITLSESLKNELATPAAYADAEIGNIYIELENYPEAVKHMERSLAGIRKIYGDHHSRVIVGLANLGIAQSKAKYKDAAFATVAEMRELAKTLSPDDWRTVTIPFLEGQIWDDSGDCQRALGYYRDALERFKKIYGPEDSHTSDVYARLGSCLRSLGQLKDALPNLERALALRRASGAAPNVVAMAAFNLAEGLWESPRPSERARALSMAAEARELWRQDEVTEKVQHVEQWIAARDVHAGR
jgi:tetratricopeptide (TPR) repeat protein